MNLTEFLKNKLTSLITGLLVSMLVLNAQPIRAQENVALDASVEVSSELSGNYEGENVVDGETNGGSEWRADNSQPLPQWVEMDFAAVAAISEIEIHSHSNHYLTEFQFQRWNGVVWEDIMEEVDANNQDYSSVFDPVYAKKVRLLINNTNSEQTRIREIEVYGSWVVCAEVPSFEVVGDDCELIVLTKGEPLDETTTWYWQGTDESGTSMGNSSLTYEVTSGGIYYLRAYNNVQDCWGEPTGKEVTATIPETPSAPIVISSTACEETLLSVSETPETGVTWYWQKDDPNGIDRDRVWTGDFNAGESGTYYLRGASAQGCWGEASEGIEVVIDYPSIPTLQTKHYEYEGTILIRDDPPSGETWWWQSTSNGVSETNGEKEYLATKAGVYYLRPKSDEGCWGESLAITLSAEEPSNFTAFSSSSPSIKLTWEASAGNETGYRISRSLDFGGTYTEIHTTAATSYTDTDLLAGTTYYYRIQAAVGTELSSGTQIVSAVAEYVYDGDSTLIHEPAYNGNISAIRWQGANDEEPQLYTYTYDGLNRLASAMYAAGATGSSNKGHFSVPSIDYDLNGNIEHLTRQGMNASGVPDVIDELTYDYGLGTSAHSNQLLGASDTQGSAGFKDGTNVEQDYIYDLNGNMTQDLNKNIMDIEYNYLNLPRKVVFDAQEEIDSIVYVYDAAGIKLRQLVYEGGVPMKTTHYSGEYIYEDQYDGSGEQLQFIQHEEGRIVPVVILSESEGSDSEEPNDQPETIEGYDYQYHLKDHLGNVRVTFSTTPEHYTMIEDFEVLGDGTGFTDKHLHTDFNLNTTEPYDTNDGVCLLQSGETGSMIFISMNKGDTIDLSVRANYQSAPGGNTFLGTAYSSIFDLFDLVYGSGIEGGITTGTSVEFNEALAGIGMSGKNASSTAPRAFLNYIFFDRDMNYVTAGFRQISTSALQTTPHGHEQIAINDIISDREGYLFAYLSNENQEAVNVHFDDFTVYHGKTNIVSASDYYPFGGVFSSYTRTASTPQNYKYNGKELQPETQLYDYGARMYDPAIGRWLHIDPMADKMKSNSPYNYAFNSPVMFVDPDGMFPIVIHVRSFAPYKSFGARGWHGDNRNFSLDPTASSRLTQMTHYETSTGRSTSRHHGNMSYSNYGAFAYSESYLNPESSSSGNIQTHLYGNNDAIFPAGTGGSLVPIDGGPTWDIDIHTSLKIATSELDDGNQLLSITGQISGDRFPNAEAYVTDSDGNQVWLGAFANQSGPDVGPFFTLAGDFNRPMMNINASIVTDKNGIFTGVRVGDQTISIEQWNKDNSGPMSVDEFKEQYKDLYNSLFGNQE